MGFVVFLASAAAILTHFNLALGSTDVNGDYTISTLLSGFCSAPYGIWGDKAGTYLYFGCTSGGVYRYDLNSSALTNVVSSVSVDGGIWGNDQGSLYFSNRFGGQVCVHSTTSLTYSTYAGGGSGSDGVRATAASLNNPMSVFGDSSGNVYFTEVIGTAGDVRKVAVGTTIISTLVTNLYDPYGGTFDNVNNYLYACNSESLSTVVRVTNGGTGTQTTVYGGGSSTSNGFPATDAAGGHVVGPVGIFVDSVANLYVSDQNSCFVRVVMASTGLIYTIAGVYGQCSESGDGGPATSASLNLPHNVWADSTGVVYLATWQGNTIRKMVLNTPTSAPTISPIPSISPSVIPTVRPTILPTVLPSVMPSVVPSVMPTVVPSAAPTPTPMPSILPTPEPSLNPSVVPTPSPTEIPTVEPSLLPTVMPSQAPTVVPTTASPTVSFVPTEAPSVIPVDSQAAAGDDSAQTSSGLVTGLIIGIAIAGFVALVTTFTTVYFYRKSARVAAQRIVPVSQNEQEKFV